MGGCKEIHQAHGVDHWSIAIKEGNALEKEWLFEVLVPVEGHRSRGDFMPKLGSPIFKCSRRNECIDSDVYMLDDEMKWKILPSMPKPNSHIVCAWVIVNNSIIITGAQYNLDFRYETCSVTGKLPFRMNIILAGFWDGWLYFTSEKLDKGPDNPQPRKVIGECGEPNCTSD
ncbi:hypothetical protein Peur_063866 [Populus x canadensis]